MDLMLVYVNISLCLWFQSLSQMDFCQILLWGWPLRKARKVAARIFRFNSIGDFKKPVLAALRTYWFWSACGEPSFQIVSLGLTIKFPWLQSMFAGSIFIFCAILCCEICLSTGKKVFGMIRIAQYTSDCPSGGRDLILLITPEEVAFLTFTESYLASL